MTTPMTEAELKGHSGEGEQGEPGAVVPHVSTPIAGRSKSARRTDEKARRVYYQNIVYAVCNTLDRINRSRGVMGEVKGDGSSRVVCGTVDEPSTMAQDLMRVVEKRWDADAAELARLRCVVEKARAITEHMLSDKEAPTTLAELDAFTERSKVLWAELSSALSALSARGKE